MRGILATTALCAALAACPAIAQQSQSSPPGAQGTIPPREAIGGGNDVFRNDAPETHGGHSPLPRTQSGAPTGGGTGAAALQPEMRQALEILSRHAITAQQFGNLATMRNTGGAIRDLGDRMVLTNSRINGALDDIGTRYGIGLPEAMPPQQQATLDSLARNATDLDFGVNFANWVAITYPETIATVERLGRNPEFQQMASAVLPDLRSQLAEAQRMVQQAANMSPADQAAGATARPNQERSQDRQVAGAPEPHSRAAETGSVGQTAERQHTPSPEPPAVQTGALYRHEQVKVDPQSQTGSLPDPNPAGPKVPQPAGELGIINTGGLFSALNNPGVEIQQLQMLRSLNPQQVRVVSVDQALPAADVDTLRRQTVTQRQQQITEMRNAIQGHQILANALQSQNIAPESVLAFDAIDEGVVVYTLGSQQAQQQQ